MRHRLEHGILLPVIVVILLGVAALGSFSFLRTRSSLSEEIIPELVIARAGDAKATVETTIAAAIETSLVLADDATIHEWIRRGEPDDVLRDLVLERLDRLTVGQDYFTTFVVNARTNNYWADGRRLLDTVSRDDEDDSWFFDAMTMETDYLLNLDYNEELGNTFLFINAPVSIDGSREGVAGVGLDVSAVVPADAAGTGGELFLIDTLGMILAASDSTHAGMNVLDFIPNLTEERIVGGGAARLVRNDMEAADGIRTGEVFVAARQVLDSPYYLIATVPTTLVDRTLRQIGSMTILTGAIVALVALVLLKVLIRRSVRAIIQGFRPAS